MCREFNDFGRGVGVYSVLAQTQGNIAEKLLDERVIVVTGK
jgi:hypothetical protein